MQPNQSRETAAVKAHSVATVEERPFRAAQPRRKNRGLSPPKAPPPPAAAPASASDPDESDSSPPLPPPHLHKSHTPRAAAFRQTATPSPSCRGAEENADTQSRSPAHSPRRPSHRTSEPYRPA